MALAVQNDSGTVAGANSYVTLAEFKAYHDDRGNSYAAYSDAQMTSACIRATDYIDGRFRYKGYRVNGTSQTTQWPRYNVVVDEVETVEGIPLEIKEACSEYALRALVAPLSPDPGLTGQIKKTHVKAGPVEEDITYNDTSSATLPVYPVADNKLRTAGLVITGGRTVRG
jgi:hypothetical protein